MFFSEDLLSSKKGSFGIIWLAATLGPKTKRITRKQLTGVDLTKTCELIAEPPEPLALRLSGCLLVGVARVYNQNYDLFYTDVTKFHSDLRRMVLTDFEAPIGPGGQPVGLDLAGDGKARIDQITFGGEDASWLTNLNSDFINMRWNHPGFVSRDRQASTQLSSIGSRNTQETDSDVSDSEEDDDSSVDDAERPRRKRKSSKNFPSSPGGKRMRPSSIPFPSSQDDIPIDIGPEGLFPDIFPDPDFPSSSPIGHLPSDFPGPDVDMPDIEGQTTPRPQSMEPNGEDGDKVPPHGSLASVEEVDGLVEPEKKKKKTKKAKKVKVDEAIEIEYDALKEVSYAERMSEERAEMRGKERSKVVDDRATALVDGGGNWINFLDPEMKEIFATCSRPGKFKWESDQQMNGGPKYHEQKHDEVIVERENQDPFGPDVTGPGQDTTYVDQYQDIEVLIQPEDPPEMARRDEDTQRAPLEPPLPWANEAFDDSSDGAGPDLGGFTPGSRLSNMTPLERKIRNSSGRHSLATGGRIGRERSESVLGDRTTDPAQLVSDENADDYDLEGEGFNPGNLPASQMRGELPEAFQPHMLASLEVQCRDFMAFTERKMLHEAKSELTFDKIVEVDSTKKVAALAFYNCLTLATKKILSVSQPTPWESITLKFSVEV